MPGRGAGPDRCSGDDVSKDFGQFTPVPDAIVREHGLIVAAVWGRMWRYAQQEDGVCRAGEQRIANDLDVGRMTVRRAKKRLMDLGYIEDTTPGIRNVPHSYRVNRCTTVVHHNEIGVPERYSGCTREVQQTAESSTTVVHEDTIEETIKESTAKESWRWMRALGEVCQVDINIKSNKGQIAKYAKELREANYTTEQIRRHYGNGKGPHQSWWYEHDFRGQKGQPPKPADIVKTIQQAVGSTKPATVIGNRNGGSVAQMGA